MPKAEEAIKQLWVQLVTQSWEDAGLKKRMLKDPAAVLREHGVEVPEWATIKAFENDPNTIVLPVSPEPPTPAFWEEAVFISDASRDAKQFTGPYW